MHYEGKSTINAPREKVWKYISDPHSTLEYVPMIQNLSVQSDDKFCMSVGAVVGWVKGEFNFDVQIVEKVPPSHTKLKAHGSGIKSVADVDIVVDLAENTSDKTDMTWTADARVGGLVAGVGQRLITQVVEKMIGELFDKLRNEMEK